MSKPITHKRLVSALTKAGMIVTKDETHTKGNPLYWATNPKNNKRIEWFTQAAFIPSTPTTDAYWDENKPITMFVCMRHPDTDAMTDLFMDTYRHTIKGAIDLLERSY